MSFMVNPEELNQIAGKVRDIEGVSVHVTEFLFGDHRIMLKWKDNKPFVIGIMLISEGKSGVMRDGSGGVAGSTSGRVNSRVNIG